MDTELRLGGKAFPRQGLWPGQTLSPEQAWRDWCSSAGACSWEGPWGWLCWILTNLEVPGPPGYRVQPQSHQHTATTCWLWDLAMPASRVATPLGFLAALSVALLCCPWFGSVVLYLPPSSAEIMGLWLEREGELFLGLYVISPPELAIIWVCGLRVFLGFIFYFQGSD